MLSFDELNALHPGGLPPGAYRYAAWRSNDSDPTSTHSQSRRLGWMAAGYRVDRVDVEAGYVLFVRTGR